MMLLDEVVNRTEEVTIDKDMEIKNIYYFISIVIKMSRNRPSIFMMS